jgi:hypothetical protein
MVLLFAPSSSVCPPAAASVRQMPQLTPLLLSPALACLVSPLHVFVCAQMLSLVSCVCLRLMSAWCCPPTAWCACWSHQQTSSTHGQCHHWASRLTQSQDASTRWVGMRQTGHWELQPRSAALSSQAQATAHSKHQGHQWYLSGSTTSMAATEGLWGRVGGQGWQQTAGTMLYMWSSSSSSNVKARPLAVTAEVLSVLFDHWLRGCYRHSVVCWFAVYLRRCG